jgi:hypothetical protein
MKNITSKDKHNDKQNLKEVYRVWVEYLKESKGYKQYCETTEMRKTYPLEVITCYSWAEGLSFSIGLDGAETDFLKLYLVFGDIHSSKFNYERWWNNRMLKLIKYASQHAPSPILLADRFIRLYAATLSKETSDLIKRGRKRIPPAFFKELLTRKLGTNKGSISLRVNSYYRTDVLIKEFTKLVEKHKKRHRITDETEDLFHNLLVPTPIAGRIVSELEDYLKVFRYRKDKQKWIDIIREMNKAYIDNDGKLIDSGRILFLGYHRKAKRIINNVERGIFPGKYT